MYIPLPYRAQHLSLWMNDCSQNKPNLAIIVSPLPASGGSQDQPADQIFGQHHLKPTPYTFQKVYHA